MLSGSVGENGRSPAGLAMVSNGNKWYKSRRFCTLDEIMWYRLFLCVSVSKKQFPRNPWSANNLSYRIQDATVITEYI